ncbi:DUF4097 domain-containing protein [Aliidiomarina halalkaliphila]|uniref:DUF4097 domain-containing protein n=1 Tax=Aliidiomarina halalkaliphila TaxID=2593535 RepID=A0A552X614_9GAMM|nr:DUF6701 domain-containing protein [Aliidiomarina halalkaliphila]TRW50458.1 DUF4097 domain-containing protein [Aliidiomarina halalkaliphila]
MLVCRNRLVITLWIVLSSAFCQVLAADYILPNEINRSVFQNAGCSLNTAQDEMNCTGSLIFGNNNDTVQFTVAPFTMNVAGNFDYRNGFKLNESGQASDVLINVGGDMNLSGGPPGNNTVINAVLNIDGSFNVGNNSTLSGDITITNGDLNVGNNSTINGSLDVDGDVTLDPNSTINGNINSTGTVTNEGTVTGYINAPEVEGGGDAGEVCDVNDNEGPCFGDTTVFKYRLNNPGTAFTCESLSIFVEVCADSGCTSLSVDEVTANLVATPNASNPDGATQTFDSGNQTFVGSQSISLAIPDPGNYDLSIQSSIAPQQGAECVGPSGCALTMVDTGFQVVAPDPVIAGNDFSVLVRSVRKDENTGACAAAVQGGIDLDIGLLCLDPDASAAACANWNDYPSAVLSVNSTVVSGHNTPTTITNVNFDSNGEALLSARYGDVGEIAMTVATSVATGATLFGESAAFVVAPASFDVRAIFDSAESPAANLTEDFHNADAFARAGEDFRMEVAALTSQGQRAPSFGLEFTAERPSVSMVAPILSPLASDADAGIPNTPVLQGVGSADLAYVGDGLFASDVVRWHEVGVFRVAARVAGGSYITSNIDAETESYPIGRFIPGYLSVNLIDDGAGSPIMPEFADAQDDFTYVGQEFTWHVAPEFEVVARSLNGTGLNNYVGPLFRLEPQTVTDVYVIANAPTEAVLTDTGLDQDDVLVSAPAEFGDPGRILLNDTRVIERLPEPMLPFNPEFAITLSEAVFTDQDGACYRTSANDPCQGLELTEIGGTQQLTGRLNLLPVSVPADDIMGLEFRAEIFACAGPLNRADIATSCPTTELFWRRNHRDNSTEYSIAWVTTHATYVIVPDSQGDLSVSDIDASLTGLGDFPLIAGQQDGANQLLLQSGGKRGRFLWIVDLTPSGINLPWLRNDWSGADALDDPQAELEFGLPRDNPRVIYQRELGW